MSQFNPSTARSSLTPQGLEGPIAATKRTRNPPTSLKLNDNAWPRAVPRPVPSDEGVCLCPPWCSRFFGRETDDTFFSHTNIKYFLFPLSLSAQTTYRHTPIHRPPNPADLSRTMESRGGTLSPGWNAKPDRLGRFFPVPFHLTYLVSIKRIVSSRTRLSGLKPWSFYERTADPHRSPRGPRPRPPTRPTPRLRRRRRTLYRRPRPTPPPHPRRKALPPSRRNLGRVLRPQPRRQPPPRRPPHLAPQPLRPHLLRTLRTRRPPA